MTQEYEEDDALSLPADTMAILEQFRKEQAEREKLELDGEVPVAEDWQVIALSCHLKLVTFQNFALEAYLPFRNLNSSEF